MSKGMEYKRRKPVLRLDRWLVKWVTRTPIIETAVVAITVSRQYSHVNMPGDGNSPRDRM
jgi:hypothetical protein